VAQRLKRSGMRAREFLNTVRREQREVIQLDEMINNKYSSLFPSAIRYDKDQVQTTPEDHLSKVLAEVGDMRKQLLATESKLRSHQTLATYLVGQINDSDARRVARMYYLTLKDDGTLWTAEEVANEEGYTERHLLRLLNQTQIAIDAICSREQIKL